MLEAIRKHVTGILAKILLGLLIVSFAVWGIGDMVRGYGRDVVASVGDTPIKATDFRQAYQTQVDNLARRFGRRLTPQEAKAFGIEQQVLTRLAGTIAVDNHGKELKLDISDKAVEQDVYKDPVFQGVDGAFSADRLNELLNQNGYSQNQYFQLRRRDTIRSHLTDSMLANVTPPKALTDMLRTYQGEERTVNYVAVKPDKVVKLGTPSQADLEKTYESNKRRFVVPEYRKFQALLLTSDAAKAQLEISDVDLKTAYERDKSAYAIPEQRRIEQIPFKDEAAATAAKAKLTAGAKFLDVAKEAGAKPSDVDLGFLTRAAVIDPTIGDAAFKLEKGKVSEVVKGRFTTVLLRVTEIKEGRQPPFDEVKGEIRKQIEDARVAEKIQALHNNIDDNRLAGKSLKEISTILKLPFLDIAAADRQGNNPDGKPALTTKDKDRLLRTAFAAEIGVENEVIELSNDGFAWLNLIAVTPEKQKEMKDVTEDVKKTWTEIETRKKLREATTALAKRANDGATLQSIADELGVKVKTTPSFKRGDSVPDVPPPAISRIFALTQGQAAATPGGDEDTRLIVQLSAIKAPGAPAEAAAKALQEVAGDQLKADIIEQYVAELHKRMPLSVNQTAIDRSTGAATDTTTY